VDIVVIYAVHPHTRGEIDNLGKTDTLMSGSSPHPWGNPLSHPLSLLCIRFIPTPVGKSKEIRKKVSNGTVHPHTRGEIVTRCLAINAFFGSSPHPWGNPSKYAEAPPNLRFIPTPVGKSLPSVATMLILSVHPHTRGEIQELNAFRKHQDGSSLHPWGNLFHPLQQC